MDLSEQISSTRVEKERVRKMKTLLGSARIFAGLVSLAAFILVMTSVDPTIWRFQSFWYGLKMFIFFFELLFLLVGYGIAFILGYGDAGAVAIMSAIHVAIFGGSETVLGIPIESLITNPLQLPQQQSLIDAAFAFLIMIAIIVALVSGVGFLKECNPALSAISFFSMNIVLGIAAMNGKLLLNLDFSSGNFFQMIFSKLVITAFLIYFSLELSFQASYIYNVIGPNVQRNRRITSNIKRLKNFKMPIGEKKQLEEDETITIKGKKTSTSQLKVTTAFSQIRALVGQKLFRISPVEDWDKMNNRLKNYYLRLEENDPFISLSLSASAYTPSLMRLFLIVLSGTLFRMVTLLLLSWLALNPVPVLRFLNLPDSVITSVESGQPEMIMLVLIPLAIFFMVMGLIVQAIQRRVAKKMTERANAGIVIHTIKEKPQEESQTDSDIPAGASPQPE